MNDDSLISRLAPVSDTDAATLVSEHAAWELADQIMRTDPGLGHGLGRRRALGQHRGLSLRRALGQRRIVLPALTAVAAGAAAAAVAITATAQPGTLPGSNAGRAPKAAALAVTSPMQLAANATTLASRSTGPGASQWVYLKVLSTISRSPQGGVMAQLPGTRQTTETWTQAGGQEAALVQDGKVTVTTILGSPEGWPRISYGYLHSLPTDPASLMLVIRHNLQTLPNPFGQGAAAPQVFDAVAALIENNPELPPRLSAALYGVLAQLPSVHLGHATNLAGQQVLSLYQTEDGYLRREIFINPVTYAYAGQLETAIRAHASGGLDGTVSVHAGEVLADDAIIASRIVDHPGER
jgi:hypothetical protein